MSNKQEPGSWVEWVESRPQVIKDLIFDFPPGIYRIKPGAPYGVSVPGTEVQMHSYLEDGTVRVIVPAKNKKPEALEHERMLCLEHGKTEEEMQKMHDSNILVNIETQWMELVERFKMI